MAKDIEEIVVDGSEREWAKAKSPKLLYSGGFGPCIVVAVYNPVVKAGHMWHSPFYTSELCSMLDDAVKGKDKRNIQAWIRGGAPIYYALTARASTGDAKYAAEDFRRDILNKVLRYLSVRNIDTRFLELGHSGEVTLDTRTGLLAEEYGWDDYDSLGLDDF